MWAILVLSAAGANVASEPLAAVPLLPAELSTLVTAAVRNHPVVQSAQAKKRAALQDVEAAERSKWPTLTATTESKVGGASGGTTDDTTLVLSGTLSAPLADGETVRIYDKREHLGDATVEPGATTWTFADNNKVGAVNSGYTARVADAAGNEGEASTEYTLTVDLTAPTTAAEVTAINDDAGTVTGSVASDGTTDDTSLEVSGTLSAALEAGETVRIYDGATYLGDAEIDSTDAQVWTFTDSRTLTDAQALSYTARVRDAAGNEGEAGTAYTVTVDRTPPTTTAEVTAIADDEGLVKGTVGNGGTTDDTTPALSGTLSAALEAGENLRIYDGGEHLGNAVIDSTDPLVWAFTDSRALTDAQVVNYTARVVDAAGNEGVAGTAYTVTFDTTAPTTTADITAIEDDVGTLKGNVESGGTTDDTTLVLSGTLSAPLADGETVRIYDKREYLGDANVEPGATTWTFADTNKIGEVNSGYTARVADAAGNEGEASTEYTLTVDLTAPTTTAEVTAINDDEGLVTGTVDNGGTTDDTSPEVSGTLSAPLADGETVRIYDGGDQYLGDATVAPGATTWTYPDLLSAPVSVSYTARVRDAAGNEGKAGTAYTVTVDRTPPTTTAAVTAIADDEGLVKGNVGNGGTTDDMTLALSGTLSAPLAAGEGVRIYDGDEYLGNAEIDADNAQAWSYADIRNLTVTDTLVVSYAARVVNAVGNEGDAGAAYTVTIQNTAPSTTVDITAISDNEGLLAGNVASGAFTDDKSPQVSGTLSAALADGETVRIYDSGQYVDDAVIDATNSKAWTFTDERPLVESQALRYTARVGDADGKEGPESDPYIATIDTPPVVTEISDDEGAVTGTVENGGSTDDPTPLVAGTLSAPLAEGEKVLIYDGANYVGEATVSSDRTWKFTDKRTLGESQVLSYTARVADSSGNEREASAPYTATIDTTRPTAKATVTAIMDDVGEVTGNVENGGTTDDTTLELSGTLDEQLAAGEIVRIYDGDNALGDATVKSDGKTWSFSKPISVNDGQTVSYIARVVDAAGFEGNASTAYTVKFETIAPTTTADVKDAQDNAGTIANGGTTDPRTLALSGTLSVALADGETVRIYDGDEHLGDATVGTGAMTWTYADSRTFTDTQVFSYTARVADAAGNEGVAGQSVVLGTNGVNTLTGTTGDDSIVGYGGPVANAGTIDATGDTLTGNGGQDTYVYRKGNVGKDTITDFTLGDLSTNPNADVLNLADLLEGYNSANIADFVRLEADAQSGDVSVKVDPNGSADGSTFTPYLQVDLSGVTLQTASAAYGETQADLDALRAAMISNGQLILA